MPGAPRSSTGAVELALTRVGSSAATSTQPMRLMPCASRIPPKVRIVSSSRNHGHGVMKECCAQSRLPSGLKMCPCFTQAISGLDPVIAVGGHLGSLSRVAIQDQTGGVEALGDGRRHADE